MEVSRPTLVTAPTVEPISLAEAKAQLALASSDTNHDDYLTTLIQSAREQWEHDTDTAVLTQTLSVNAERFGEDFYLPKRPIQSISSVTYYDSANALQTLSTSIYALNAQEQELELKYLQVWPVTVCRFDAVTVTYVAGYASVTLVPALWKHAMKLLIGHYFENRDMLMSEAMQSMPAYEALARRFMRSSYP